MLLARLPFLPSLAVGQGVLLRRARAGSAPHSPRPFNQLNCMIERTPTIAYPSHGSVLHCRKQGPICRHPWLQAKRCGAALGRDLVGMPLAQCPRRAIDSRSASSICSPVTCLHCSQHFMLCDLAVHSCNGQSILCCWLS